MSGVLASHRTIQHEEISNQTVVRDQYHGAGSGGLRVCESAVFPELDAVHAFFVIVVLFIVVVEQYAVVVLLVIHKFAVDAFFEPEHSLNAVAVDAITGKPRLCDRESVFSGQSEHIRQLEHIRQSEHFKQRDAFDRKWSKRQYGGSCDSSGQHGDNRWQPVNVQRTARWFRWAGQCQRHCQCGRQLQSGYAAGWPR